MDVDHLKHMHAHVQFEPGKGPFDGRELVFGITTYGDVAQAIATYLLTIGEPHGMRGVAVYNAGQDGDGHWPLITEGEYTLHPFLGEDQRPAPGQPLILCPMEYEEAEFDRDPE